MNDYFLRNASLFDWRENALKNSKIVEPWKPRALEHEKWPPNYKAVYAWRIQQLKKLQNNPELLKSAKAYYKTRPAEFIMHWCDTYDPRKKHNKWMPFVFFKRQAEFIEFLQELIDDDESGLVEKCRDAGVTWLAIAFSVHQFIFKEGNAIGWGSRKQDLVDKLGDPDSIFEKIRLLLARIPNVFIDEYKAVHLQVLNHRNNSVIKGEAGDNIGRGGRMSAYMKDESAHYERPEKIEAALGDVTNTQVDISSVNGLGNVFHKRRENGLDWSPGVTLKKGYVRVFVFDWRDHPAKTQEWYDTRKAKYEREGLTHLFAQEVDRDYSAAVQNTIIPLAWIKFCVDAHKKIKWKDERGNIRIGFEEHEIPNIWGGGLDIADGGIDRNALVKKQWIILRSAEEWTERDTGVTTRRTVASCRNLKNLEIQYDCIGYGSGVKAEYNRLIEDKIVTDKNIKFIPWNAGSTDLINPYERVVLDDEESPFNCDVYYNLKAQAWGFLRTRVYKTFKNITEGVLYPPDELISLDSSIPLLQQVMKEMAQATSKDSTTLKALVEKQPSGTKSPNLADGIVMTYHPIERDDHALTGKYQAV